VNEFLSIPSRGRFSTRFQARRTGSLSQSVIECRTENISVTGMLIEADAELRQGDRIQYSLDLANRQSFSMLAEVVRTERFGAPRESRRYGVRFSRIDPAARRAIEVLISQSSAAH
jgi:c-di-GMP-binding flagellar brake protein YcgR